MANQVLYWGIGFLVIFIATFDLRKGGVVAIRGFAGLVFGLFVIGSRLLNLFGDSYVAIFSVFLGLAVLAVIYYVVVRKPASANERQ